MGHKSVLTTTVNHVANYVMVVASANINERDISAKTATGKEYVSTTDRN